MFTEKLNKRFGLDKIDNSWLFFFTNEAKKEYFVNLLTILDWEYNNHVCWPQIKDIFRLFREITLEAIKVVVLGQDPYCSSVADGIAFSSKTNYAPPSLKNILLELSRDLDCQISNRVSLLPWVKEGVFLFNTALSVRGSQPLSHTTLWEMFTNNILSYISINQQIVWVFWGQKAQKIKKSLQIDNTYSIVSSHPSPYSAHGFFSTRPFSRVNSLLIQLNKKPINWLSICSE